jgi:hypothetical protein
MRHGDFLTARQCHHIITGKICLVSRLVVFLVPLFLKKSHTLASWQAFYSL